MTLKGFFLFCTVPLPPPKTHKIRLVGVKKVLSFSAFALSLTIATKARKGSPFSLGGNTHIIATFGNLKYKSEFTMPARIQEQPEQRGPHNEWIPLKIYASLMMPHQDGLAWPTTTTPRHRWAVVLIEGWFVAFSGSVLDSGPLYLGTWSVVLMRLAHVLNTHAIVGLRLKRLDPIGSWVRFSFRCGGRCGGGLKGR